MSPIISDFKVLPAITVTKMIGNPYGCKYQNYINCDAAEMPCDTVYICIANSREAKPVCEDLQHPFSLKCQVIVNHT